MSEQRNSNILPGSYHPLHLADEVGFLSGKALGDFGNDVTIEPLASDPAHSKGPFRKAFRLPTIHPLVICQPPQAGTSLLTVAT